MPKISIVIPVFNEQGCLEALFERLRQVERAVDEDFEYIFVDDGSTDGSGEIIRVLARSHDNIRYIMFSRNFGHEAALTAGLDHAGGDAAVIIDADLQDPPEVIPELIAKWNEGFKIVYAQRRRREGESVAKKWSSWLFYRIIRMLSGVDIPVDTGDFRLMDSAVVEQFRRCREGNRFVRGLVAWTGFQQTAVLYDRDARHAGRTKYGFFKLLRLALDAVFSFSDVPLRIGVYIGIAVVIFSVLMVVNMICQKLFLGLDIPGYALMVSGMFFLGGVQLAMLGLVGDYVGRVYRQTQNRPLYIIFEKSDKLPHGDEGLAQKHKLTDENTLS